MNYIVGILIFILLLMVINQILGFLDISMKTIQTYILFIIFIFLCSAILPNNIPQP